MAIIQGILKYTAIILSLFICLEVSLIECRKLKSRTDQQEIKYDFQSTSPGNSPGIGHHFAEYKENLKAKSPGHSPGHVKARNHNEENNPGNGGQHNDNGKDHFGVSTQGHSPGIGHSVGTVDGDTELPKAMHDNMNVKKHSEEYKDGFRPTSPGHSPSIGHAIHQDSKEPNA